MKIQIYGPGCENCKKLYANAEAAAKSAGIAAELEKITEIDAIVAAGVMMTPALAVDGKIASSGRVLSVCEIAELLGAAPVPKRRISFTPTAKRAIALLLLLFVAGSVGAMLYRESKLDPPPNAPAHNAEKSVVAGITTVYYFHGDRRCVTCKKIEELTRNALSLNFGHEMETGTVLFRSVNLDEPENEHFVQDFGLDSKIVVIQKGDKFEKLPEVWTLVKNPEKFTAYIRQGVEQMR